MNGLEGAGLFLIFGGAKKPNILIEPNQQIITPTNISIYDDKPINCDLVLSPINNTTETKTDNSTKSSEISVNNVHKDTLIKVEDGWWVSSLYYNEMESTNTDIQGETEFS
eukprot:233808_1